MVKWTIYDKEGNVRHESITEYNGDGEVVYSDSLEYNGTWMGECFLNVTVKSAYPIDFRVGDYIIYRDEKFAINYDPSVVKKARRGTYGEGFMYESIKFNALHSELTDIMFLDYVLYDNHVHYSSLPVFPFYAATVDDYLDRLQANTNRYCSENGFEPEDYWLFLSPTTEDVGGVIKPVRTIQRAVSCGMTEQQAIAAWNEVYGVGYEAPESKKDLSISVSNETIWSALARIKNDFDLNFITRGRVVSVGMAGLPTSDIFKYGKDKGLYEIERVADTDQQLITKLFAYGSEKNLPIRYYANLGKVATISGVKESDPSLGMTTYFIKTNLLMSDIKPAIIREDTNLVLEYNGYTCHANADGYMDGGVQKVALSLNLGIYTSETVAFYNAYVNNASIEVKSGIDIDKWPPSLVDYDNTFPNNMAVNKLMLPGFPEMSLYDWVKANGGVDCHDDTGLASWNGYTAYFSKERLNPYILSVNYQDIGIRESSKTFDGSDDTDEIFPTIENTGFDRIAHAEVVRDNGVFEEGDDEPTVAITLPSFDADFNLKDQVTLGDSPAIVMKDGYCGARSFALDADNIERVNDQWKCTCKREHDTLLDLWFPYSYNASIGQTPTANEPYQVRGSDVSGYDGDKYVLTGIPMTASYINAAAKKLLEAALEFLSANEYVRYSYMPKVDELYMIRQHNAAVEAEERSLYLTIKEGDIMLFKDDDLGIDGSVFIDQLTIKENGNNGIPTYDVTLRNDKQVGTMQRIQQQIDSLSNGGGSQGSGGGGGNGGGISSGQIEGFVDAYGSELFLSKKNDDTAAGVITFLKGLISEGEAIFKGLLTAWTAKINEIRSHNFTGWGVADTGFELTNNYDGTGASGLVVDYIYARMKLVAEALELKKYEVSAGDQMYSMAANYISRTEYYDENGDTVGWTTVKVPWLLNKMPFLLRHLPNALGIFASTKVIRSTMSDTDLKSIRTVRCYFLAEDDDREIENWWRVGDLARCQTLNVVSAKRDDFTGVTRKAGNIFWWRKVKGVSANTGTVEYRYINAAGNIITQQEYDALTSEEKEAYWIKRDYNGTKIAEDITQYTGPVTLDDGKKYHWIDVEYNWGNEHNGRDYAPSEWAGAAILSDIPCAGDTAVQFGHVSDPNRMNLMTLELNGLMNADAPCIKIYRGIYCYDLNKCWWGGNPRKMKLSPSTGYEFYGPSFRFIQEYGIARVPVDRGAWTDIAFERDDYTRTEPTYSDDSTSGRTARQVRKCYYYDRVTHNGSLWLCVASNLDTGEGAHWIWDGTSSKTIDGTTYAKGDYLPNSAYNTLPDSEKALCTRKQDHIVSEPADNSADWEKQVAKGEDGASAWVADLDNNMSSVALDSGNHPAAQQVLTTNVLLYYGATAKTPVVTSIVRHFGSSSTKTWSRGDDNDSYNGVKVNWSGAAITITYGTSATITDRDDFTINIRDSVDTTVTRTLTFPVVGLTGDARYELLPSASSIVQNASGVCTPSTISCSYTKFDVKKGTTETNPSSNDCTITYIPDSGTEVTNYTPGASLTPGTDFNRSITFKLKRNSVVIDTETINIVKDGTNGANATDYYTMVLSPQSVVYGENYSAKEIAIKLQHHVAGQSPADVTANEISTHSTGLYLAAQYKSSASGSATWNNISGLAFSVTSVYAQNNTYINFELRKVNNGSSYNIDNPSTYSVLDTKTLIVTKDGEDGADGFTVEPANVIINQDINNPTGLNSLSEDVNVIIRCGATSFTPTTVTVQSVTNITPSGITPTSTTSSTASSGTAKFTITKIGTYTYTDGSVSKTQYFDRVRIQLSVTFTKDGASVTLTQYVNVYINLLGSFKQTIEDDVEHSVATKTYYVYDKDGNVVAQQNIADYIRSSSMNSSALQATVGDENGGLVQKTSLIEQTVDNITLELTSINKSTKGRNFLIGSAFVANESAAGNLAIDEAFFAALPDAATNDEPVYIGVSCYVRIASEDTGTSWANYNTYDYKSGSRSADHRIGFEPKFYRGNTNTHTLPCWGLPNGYTGSGSNTAYVNNYNNTTHYEKVSVGAFARIKRVYKITYTAGNKPTSVGQLQYFNQLLGTNSGGTQGYSMRSCVGFAKMEILTAQDVNLITDWCLALGETVNDAANLIDFKGTVEADTWEFQAARDGSSYQWVAKNFRVMGLTTSAGMSSLVNGKVVKVWVDAKITSVSGITDPPSFYLYLTDGNSYMGCNLVNGSFSEPSPDHPGYTRYYMYQRFTQRTSSSGNVIPNTAYSSGSSNAGCLTASFARGNYNIADVGISLPEYDFESMLRRTGIDITDGKINLQADKVTFCDSSGGNTDKISIDPTTGTLKAVNGNFSGKIKADVFISYPIQVQQTSGIITMTGTEEGSFFIFQPTGTLTVDISALEIGVNNGREFTFMTTVDGTRINTSAYIRGYKTGQTTVYYFGTQISLQAYVPVRLIYTSLGGWFMLYGYASEV